MRTEVYSWRVSRELKAAIEATARKQGASVATLLEHWSKEALARIAVDDANEQERLHAASEKHVGSIRGEDPQRASHARDIVKQRLGAARARRPRPR
jgi:hypothetical protein